MRLSYAGGFTLVEVLVALLVLAVGIAGAAAAQVAATRTRHDTMLMATAVQLAASLAERIRAHPSAAYAAFDYQAGRDGPPTAVPFCDGACDAARLAEADLAELRAALHAEFPGGRALVCRDARVWDETREALAWECTSTPQAPLVVKLGWRMRRADGSAIDDAPALAMVVGP